MLADGVAPEPRKLGLADNVQIASTQLFALIAFIGAQLPLWRDRPGRPIESTETVLTSQFSRHLNGVARKSPVWNIFQFGVEDSDEIRRSRKIDIGAGPSGVTIWIDGRSYSDFELILPIECKRLPTPTGRKRDPREYLFSSLSTTGGVQRFKAGHHGSKQDLCAMIAYVQAEDIPAWHIRVNGWVAGLVTAGESGWSADDALTLDNHDQPARVALLQSRHARVTGSDVELRHLWIEM